MVQVQSGGVFISYSRKDTIWLERLQTMLRPAVRVADLTIWDDSEIEPGAVWQDEIKRAVGSARVAVLLVTANFLASSFIVEHELPWLLGAADRGEMDLLWIAVGVSLFRHTALVEYQAVNDVARSLAELKPEEWERELGRIAEVIVEAIAASGSARALESRRRPTAHSEERETVERPLRIVRSRERPLYDSNAEEAAFASWSLHSSVRGFSERIQHAIHEETGVAAMRLLAKNTETVGINKSIRVIRGRVEVDYKVEWSTSENHNIFFFLIPMQETGTGRTGLIEVGANIQGDPRNGFSAYRTRFVVPKRHYGDGDWHRASIPFDFTDIDEAYYSICAPRINEGSVYPGAAGLIVASIRIFGHLT